MGTEHLLVATESKVFVDLGKIVSFVPLRSTTYQEVESFNKEVGLAQWKYDKAVYLLGVVLQFVDDYGEEEILLMSDQEFIDYYLDKYGENGRKEFEEYDGNN